MFYLNDSLDLKVNPADPNSNPQDQKTLIQFTDQQFPIQSQTRPQSQSHKTSSQSKEFRE